MKKIFSLLLISVCLISTHVCFAKEFDEYTGKDWVSMTDSQKEMFVYTGIGGLQQKGIFIKNLPSYYVTALDKVLKLDPEMEKEYLDDLFVFCVHESEPHAQKAIDAMKQKSIEEQKERPLGNTL